MAFTIKEVTVISLSAVGTNLVNNILTTPVKNTARVVEIVGGLVTAQFAKSAVAKAAGVGVLTGALVNFVNGVFGICKTSYPVSKSTGYYTNYPVDYNNGARNTNYCPSCNKK